MKGGPLAGAAGKRLRSPGLHLAAIAAVVFLAYSNTFHVPLQFDDPRFLRDNPVVEDFSYFVDGSRAESLAGHRDRDIPRFFRTRYVAFLSFWANNRVAGPDLRAYHGANTLVHLANAWLVYWLLLLILAAPRLRDSRLRERAGEIALVTSLLFAAHPLQTQAVTYISQRFASLATLFYLLSLTLYVHSGREGGRPWKARTWYLLSLACAVGAMKTKEIAFTLPLAAAAYELFFLEGRPGKRALRLAPLAATMLIIPLALLGGGGAGASPGADRMEATRLHTTVSRGDYALTQTVVVARYLRLLLFPAGQNLDYDFPVYDSFLRPAVLLSSLLLLALALAAAAAFRAAGTRDPGWRVPAFGVLWFFLTLSVESSVIPISDVIFEHRVYLPAVGFFAAAVSAIYLALGRVRHRLAAPAATAALLAAATVLAAAAHSRNRVWQSDVALWEDVVRKSPKKVRGHNNLGNAYLRQKRYDEAIEHYLFALQARQENRREDVDYAEVHYNLGLAYAQTQRPEKAAEHYRQAIALNPRNYDAYNNLGVAFFDMGLLDEALKYYETAVRLSPDMVHVYFNLGEAHALRGDHGKAVDSYRTYLRYRPDSAEGHLNIGLSYRAAGDRARAVAHLRRALDLRPGWEEARSRLEDALADRGGNGE